MYDMTRGWEGNKIGRAPFIPRPQALTPQSRKSYLSYTSSLKDWWSWEMAHEKRAKRNPPIYMREALDI